MSSKKKRAAIDLSLEVEGTEEDHSRGGGGDREAAKDGGVHKEEEQLKEQEEARPKEETGEEKVVEVVVDQEGEGTKEEIKYRTQQGEEMEEDKQSAEDGRSNDESDGAETRAEDNHVLEAAAGNGAGEEDNSHTTMEQDEVTLQFQGYIGAYCLIS